MANVDVAEQIVISRKQVYLSAKSIGSTTLTLWAPDGRVAKIFNIIVHVPIDPLKENLSKIFPDEKEVTVSVANEHIVLTGLVSTQNIKEKVGKLAEAYAPAKVLN